MTKQPRAALVAKFKHAAHVVWCVPAVESLAATLIIRWLTLIGAPALVSTAIFEAIKAVIA